MMDVEAAAGTTAAASLDDKIKSRSNPSLVEERSIDHGDHDILGKENVDRVLAAKMVLVNDVSFFVLQALEWKCRGISRS